MEPADVAKRGRRVLQRSLGNLVFPGFASRSAERQVLAKKTAYVFGAVHRGVG